MYNWEMAHETPQEPKSIGELIVRYESDPIQLELLDLGKPTDPVVRPDYNIGKHMGVIFLSPKSPRVYEKRKHILKVDQATGATTSVVVHPLRDCKTPTFTSGRVLLGLIELWNQQGQSPQGEVSFSAQQLYRSMGRAWQGSSSAELIREQIQVLRYTAIDFFNSYKDENGEPVVAKTGMTILVDATYLERQYVARGSRFDALHKVKINPDIVASIVNNNTRPLNGKTIKEISDDTAGVLFTILDLHLSSIPSSKPAYRRRNATNLIREDLLFTSKRYDQKNNRKVLLDRLVKNLDGRELINGKLHVWVEDSADGKDYNFCYKKVRRIEPKPRNDVKPVCNASEAESIAVDLIDQILRHPNHGNPNKGVLMHFAKYLPEQLLAESLSLAKTDYKRGYSDTDDNKKPTSLSATFVGIAKRLANERGFKFPEKQR